MDVYEQLREHLDRMPIGFPPTASGVELRLLRFLFTEQQARIALEMSAMAEPARVIAKRLKGVLDEAGVERALEEMFQDGLIHRSGQPGARRYGKLMFIVGIYERQLKRMTPEFERDARAYMDEALHRAYHTGGTTQIRTVPVQAALPAGHAVGSREAIRAFVESSPGPFAKSLCICRHGKDLLGEGCRTTSQRENCLMLEGAAETMVELGTARFIDKAEMLRLLEEADREGLVLQPQNTRNPIFICCCCGCCCGVLTSAKKLPKPAQMFHSAFRAQVDASVCSPCGLCETRCPMGAIAGDEPVVEEERCIGCGLCVSTCPTGALALHQREGVKEPPADTGALYMQILKERYGAVGLAKLAGRKLVSGKI